MTAPVVIEIGMPADEAADVGGCRAPATGADERVYGETGDDGVRSSLVIRGALVDLDIVGHHRAELTLVRAQKRRGQSVHLRPIRGGGDRALGEKGVDPFDTLVVTADHDFQ